jgi:DNA-directed RNA polymerase specialized sigma24 family protein
MLTCGKVVETIKYHTEIAEMLNISAGTSKSNLSKARAYLTKLISNTKIKLFF